VTAGISAPNGIMNTGLELTSKWELMIMHPIVIRAGIDYRIGSIIAPRYPDGTLHVRRYLWRGWSIAAPTA